MARNTSKTRAVPPVDSEVIVITQVVARIVPGDSEMSMLQAAFLASAKFIEGNANGKTPIDLSFEHGDDKFQANYVPPPWTEEDQRNQDELDRRNAEETTY